MARKITLKDNLTDETLYPQTKLEAVYDKSGNSLEDAANFEASPEYVQAVTDSDDRVLYGVKTNGDFHFGAGIPSQVLAAANAAAENKVDKEYGKSLINEQFADSQSYTDTHEKFAALEVDNDDNVMDIVEIDGSKEHKTKHTFDREVLFRDKVEMRGSVDLSDEIVSTILSNNINDGSVKALYPKYEWEGYMANLATTKNLGVQNDRTYKPLVLQHFSDIHNDAGNFKRVLEFHEMYKKYIADILLSGDVAGNDWQGYSAAMTGLDGYYDVLKIIGNHDVYNYNNTSGTNATEAQCYARYMQGIDKWGVVYTDNVCYWYKDYVHNTGTKTSFAGSAFSSSSSYTQGALVTYGGKYYKALGNIAAGSFNVANWKEITSFGIRLIAYDFMHISTAQTNWLSATLSDALDKGLSVIITTHGTPFLEDKTAAYFNTPFSGDEWWPKPENSSMTPWSVVEAVSSFMDNGGEFICYLSGHIHTDVCGYFKTGTITTTGGSTYTNNHKQVFIAVGLASGYGVVYDYDSGGQSELDIQKVTGTKTLDLFNIESFDTETKTISVLRVGCDIDRLLRSRRSMVIDYKNSELLYSR